MRGYIHDNVISFQALISDCKKREARHVLQHTDDYVFCFETLIHDCDVIGVRLSMCSRVPLSGGEE